MEHNLELGSRWEFVNATTGKVTEYVLDFVPAASAQLTQPARLLNEATGNYAQVWTRSLLRPSKNVSHWRPA